MPPMNPKNMPLSSAGSVMDLGLGQLLKEQLATEEQARKDKLAKSMAKTPLLGMGAAAQSLFGQS